MPTYEYRCENCQQQFEQFQSIKAKPLRKCPECGKARLVRLIGSGAGIIFKGSGFYQTDYRSESYNKASKTETSVTAGKDNAKPESKQAAQDIKKPASPKHDAVKKSGGENS